MEFKEEYNFLILLLVIGISGYLFPTLFGLQIFSKIITVLTIICALRFARYFLKLDSISEKIYNAGVLSLLIVIASIFLEKVLEVLGVSIVYGVYLEGFGYLLAFILILIAAFNSMGYSIKIQ